MPPDPEADQKRDREGAGPGGRPEPGRAGRPPKDVLPDEDPDEVVAELPDEDPPAPVPVLPDEDPPPKAVPVLPDDPVPDAAAANDVQKPLEKAEDLLNRGSQVFKALFKEARNWPEYRRVLATPERNALFESKLLAAAKAIDSRLGTNLPDNVLIEVVERMASSIAAWEHSPKRQRERQRKQAQGRRHKNRGRDLHIVRGIENGESQRRVAARFKLSRGAVEHVLLRDAPHLLERRKKDERPPD